ncbi:MAG TPA: N-(5'-phosphoribosyl)anthranilate isomerase [Lachnospiraceae bacterium]|nr:N-(5'-phosphoribosyl)anthranilate isomerase [Lachnospiraceae bacterium]HCX40744.1 N-(5'-phosphoribosyl)anthranilate isomerase [Lachnospiraceae bacterium]
MIDCKVKICGLHREEDICCVNAYLPDYIGFVFYPESKRYVTGEQAQKLKEKLDPRIRAVGVFVNADPDEVIALLQKNIIDIAQLHGQESEEELRKIREQTGKPVIRAVKVTEETNLQEAYQTDADYILLDNGMGSGKPFPWDVILKQLAQEELQEKICRKPFFLAGGIDPENMERAAEAFRPYALDLSSSVETDGVKDPEKIRKLMETIRKRGTE